MDPALKDKLSQLEKTEQTYQPNSQTADGISQKILVMIVGPSSIGKSTLMNQLVAQTNDFARVSGFTTRQKRPNDEPGLYRYLDTDTKIEEILERIDSGEVVQYAIFSATGMMYGSELIDYPDHYNLLDTVFPVVKPLRRLPFERTVTIALVTQPSIWERWFRNRFPESSVEASKRLEEAKKCLEWMLTETNKSTYFYENNPNTEVKILILLIKDLKNNSFQNKALITSLIQKAIELQKEYNPRG